ncbi:MAG: SymE family type I addiction module toxin [Erysipelotrichaceae bacterium]|nr:SymE family type I addiction module toxin [Erysipelotrichaceae bacterium]
MVRKIKVYERLVTRYLKYNRAKHKYVPQIILTGNWLEKAGFLSGDNIEVDVNNERIVITKLKV